MPTDRVLKVSEQHIWVGIEDYHGFLGLTNFAQSELGQIISVDLPDVGDEVEKGEPFAELESLSTVSELVAPVSGKVLSVNPDLDVHPSIINEDPYNEGWLVEVRLKDASDLDSLMDMDEYYHFVFKPDSE
jgi:glycine cleavage system H protein